MDTFTEFIAEIEQPEQRARVEEVLTWATTKFPTLEKKIAWNQPMLTDHGTFIIGFSVSKKHFAVAPEALGIEVFSDQIKEAGYGQTKNLMQIPWESPIDYGLLERMIEFNISDKANYSSFWRK